MKIMKMEDSKMKKYLMLIIAFLLIAWTPLVQASELIGPGGSLTNLTDCGKYATLQTCINVAGVGGTWWVPSGTYDMAGTPLSILNEQTGTGAGIFTVITNSGAGDTIDLTGSSGSHLSGINLSNFRVSGTDATASCISASYLDYSTISKVQFNACPYRGLSTNYTVGDEFFTNWFLGNKGVSGYPHVYLANDTGSSWHHNKIIQTVNTHGFGIYTAGNNNDTDITFNYLSYLEWGIYEQGGEYNNISDNKLDNILAQGISEYGSWIATSRNIITNTPLGMWLGGYDPVVTDNMFRFVLTAIVFGQSGGHASGNVTNGGAIYQQASNIKTFTSGQKTDVWGLYGMIASNNRYGSAGITSPNTFYDRDTSLPFQYVKAGDILHIPNLSMTAAVGLQKSFWTVKSVSTDSQTLTLTENILLPSNKIPIYSIQYEVWRDVSYIDDLGNINLPKQGVLKGGGRNTTEQIVPAAVSSGSITTINSTPTAGGSAWAIGDLFKIEIPQVDYNGYAGLGTAIGKVLTISGNAAATVALIDSGDRDYTVATGWVTTAITPGSTGTGLTIEITAVGLSVAQVSDTIITNTGQGPNSINNPLPTEKSGQKFSLIIGEAQAANYCHLTAFTPGNICLDGTCGKNWVGIAVPTQGAELLCKTYQATLLGVNSSAALAISTTPFKQVANGAFTYDIAGHGYSQSANAAGTAISTGVIPASKWGLYEISVIANGTVAVTPAAGNATGYDTEALAIAGLPATPGSSADMGYITVTNTTTGGFIAGTTALNGTGVTAHYYSTAAYTKPYYWNCKTEIGTWATN
jgi:hypothetical protein